MTAAEDTDTVMNCTMECMRGLAECLEGSIEKGVIYGKGVYQKGDIATTPQCTRHTRWERTYNIKDYADELAYLICSFRLHFFIFCPIFLQPALFAVAVESPVGYYQVVQQVYAHNLASLLHSLCKHVILSAWSQAVTRMIMA